MPKKMTKKTSDSERRESTILGTIQQQGDAESLVDSIAFGPDSKLKYWDDKLQSLKGKTPGSCEKSRKLYNDIADGITGKRSWKSPSRRMDAAKALMLSDKLQWIPKNCNPKGGKSSRTKRHAKSHKMKRKHKQKSKHKQKHTRKMNRKTNNRSKTRRKTRRGNQRGG